MVVVLVTVYTVYVPVWLRLLVAWHTYIPLSFLCSELKCNIIDIIMPTSSVDDVFRCPGDTLVVVIVFVIVESVATGRPSFSHEMVGSG